MSRSRKLLSSLAVVGLAGTLVGLGTYSAFYSETSNDNNSFSVGTVYITDNDSGSAMYQMVHAKPGTSQDTCIAVTYNGTLASNVSLYLPSPMGAVGQYVDFSITAGTGTVPFGTSCAGFTAGPSVYTGTLAGYAAAHNSTANALPLSNAGGGGAWNQNDKVVYRFTVTQQDNNAANNGSNGSAVELTTGSHQFVWRAQNI
ncbi:MAG: hypothetical protein NVSMB13_04800 [Mycobacteriales bacterium]